MRRTDFMRVIALLATYNEQRFIAGCMEHLARQGVHVYLIDNESMDATVEIAKKYNNLIGVETYPRGGVYKWKSILQRKEELAFSLDADWFMHVDADERHLPADGFDTLAKAFEAVDALGYSAVEFHEFTFVPTVEHPDHDHPDYELSMKWYYHFAPRPLHLMRAWKKQPVRVDLASAGGHRIVSPQLKVYPRPFQMKHYLFVSREHAAKKYINRGYEEGEVREHWHGWRARLVSGAIQLPGEAFLETTESASNLKTTNPWKRHWIDISLDLYNRFYIKEGYNHRARPEYPEDGMTENAGVIHQPDVYPLAAELGKELGCTHIIDIGCGRAHKLSRMHPRFQLVGLDAEENINYCRSHYSFGQWLEYDLDKDTLELDEELLKRSVVICSGIIEHLMDPHALLANLSLLMGNSKLAILSTPERDLVRGYDDMGPPADPCHLREWNSSELRDLLQAHGLHVGYVGLTIDNYRDRQRNTTLVLIDNTSTSLDFNRLLQTLGLSDIFTPVAFPQGSEFQRRIYSDAVG
jgi:2-polyprenyl-3-methyl-5-hydroxy-6-metoxy-1,4-benzoquinol methylase